MKAPSERPQTISQLASLALENLWDDTRELKHYLRMAERYRKNAKQHVLDGNLEEAFVDFARAATLVLERIPTHREFGRLLSGEQRKNLNLNGHEMLEKMGEIKPILTERLHKWLAEHPDEVGVVDDIPADDQRQVLIRWADEQDRPGISEVEGRRMIREEMERWDKFNDEQRRAREAKDTTAEDQLNRSVDGATTAITTAQRAAGQLEQDRARMQNEASQRERKRQEKVEIAQRQKEADEAAQLVRQTIAANNLSSTATLSYPQLANASVPALAPQASLPSILAPGRSSTSEISSVRTPMTSRPASFHDPPRLPVESPSSYYEGDSTDSEILQQQRTGGWRRNGHHHPLSLTYPKTTMPVRSPSYPPPITTATATRIDYPQLMTQHQKRQGYHPSNNSMFVPLQYPNHLLAAPANVNNAPPIIMPQPEPAPPPITPLQQQQQQQRRPSPEFATTQYRSYTRPPPPLPSQPSTSLSPRTQAISATTPLLRHHSINTASKTASHTPIRTPTVASVQELDALAAKQLRQVTVPRECLPRFLTIAKANTDLNLETCGLLLGRDRGAKFAVTTLLIPRQHSTSDTCSMDEEELVMSFTEERGLITLGWIHTHPSQSCFMSSVDLHTHSGFQRMLPESFAVVCAPKCAPNFGIFRLTDPPGLKTVLDCRAKEAFHPHPDLPIYTDADKGHVVMKDLPLEIVDLR